MQIYDGRGAQEVATSTGGGQCDRISEIQVRPNLATAEADAGRQAAHAAAREAAKTF